MTGLNTEKYGGRCRMKYASAEAPGPRATLRQWVRTAKPSAGRTGRTISRVFIRAIHSRRFEGVNRPALAEAIRLRPVDSLLFIELCLETQLLENSDSILANAVAKPPPCQHRTRLKKKHAVRKRARGEFLMSDPPPKWH